MSIRFQSINLDANSGDGLVVPVSFSSIGLAHVTDPALQIRAHLDDAQDFIPLTPGAGWEGIAADKVRIHWDKAYGHRANLAFWGPRVDRPQPVRPVKIEGACTGWNHRINGGIITQYVTYQTSSTMSSYAPVIGSLTNTDYRYVIDAARAIGAVGSTYGLAFQVTETPGPVVFSSQYSIGATIWDMTELIGLAIGPGQRLEVKNVLTGTVRCEFAYRRIPVNFWRG